VLCSYFGCEFGNSNLVARISTDKMNRHQVLTGAANSGDRCYAVGNINGVHFTVCII